MKTAMQDLEEKLKDNLKQIILNADYELMEKLFSEALEKEKEQIIDFANCFYDDCVMEGGSLQQSAEEYYNQTFNQNK
jgi:hypothetical protein